MSVSFSSWIRLYARDTWTVDDATNTCIFDFSFSTDSYLFICMCAMACHSVCSHTRIQLKRSIGSLFWQCFYHFFFIHLIFVRFRIWPLCLFILVNCNHYFVESFIIFSDPIISNASIGRGKQYEDIIRYFYKFVSNASKIKLYYSSQMKNSFVLSKSILTFSTFIEHIHLVIGLIRINY